MNQPRVRAPRLPEDPDLWLNTGTEDAAPRLLPGTVYLLDFWTYGCVNCRHVLNDLAYLEERYRGRPFRVIGVHSPKFDREKGADGLRRAVERLGVRHPVVCDDDHALRRAYAVRAWPTLALIDGAGYVVATLRGEGHREALAAAIDALLLARPGTDALPEFGDPAAAVDDTPLRFPGKVLADGAGGRLFIADTGHHRIVVAPLTGGTRGSDYTYIGSGAAGFTDGDFADAGLRAPQGMALSADGTTLYVADAGNHAIRRVDLDRGRVATVAGTGRRALGPVRPAGTARGTDLNSPWDLCLSDDGGTLYVALAGAHQITALDLRAGALSVLAGSGREARADGVGADAAFAQPSGIARDGGTLYVADAEASALRAVEVASGRVRTLAGGDLFDFGFADGTGEAARFQHPLGVAATGDGQVYVADAYNHRVRRVEAKSGAVDTVAGSGEAVEMDEPGGVSVAGDTLYVADTNGHRVRRLDLATGRLEDAPLGGLCLPGACTPAASTGETA